jgi:hypothetical protein
MSANDRLDILGKKVGLLNDFAKFAGVMLLTIFALAVWFFPGWVKQQLAERNFTEFSAAGFKMVIAAETVKANGNAIEVANALTTTEIKLKSILSTFDGVKSGSSGSAVSRSEVETVLTTVRSAQDSLDRQTVAITSTGKEVGATRSIPETGWVFVGYFDSDANLKRLSERLEKNAQVQQLGDNMKEIVLAYDAPVVSDGNLCNKVDISAVPQPDLSAPEREYVIVRASPSPLKILAQVHCPGPGKGSVVHVQIAVPKDRVRIAKLSQVDRRGI